MNGLGLLIVALSWAFAALCWIETRLARRCIQDILDIANEHDSEWRKMANDLRAKLRNLDGTA